MVEEPAVAERVLPPLPELHLLVPDGATNVLVAKPRSLMTSQAVREVVGAVIAPELIDSFERRTGVDPTEVTQVVAAEYDRGFVLIARGPWPASDVVRAAELRMSTVEASSDEPFVRRLGYLGRDLRDVIALADDVVMVAGGVPDVVSAILVRATRGEWPEGRSAALATADVAPLVEQYRAAPLQLYVPEPLELPEGFATSVLLARQRSLAATIVPEDEVTLGVAIALVGELPEGAEDNFRAMVESIGRSGLGAALGIAEAAETLSVQVDDESAVLRMRVRSSSLATGLRVLFVAQLEELLGGPPSAP